MDELRARIHDDLRGLIEGDLLFEPLERAPYATDASLYEIDPLGVVAPRTREDLAAVVRYAGENAISIHARSAAGALIEDARVLERLARCDHGGLVAAREPPPRLF